MGNWHFEVSGMDELSQMFDQAPKKANKAAKKALYKGAGIVADALTKEVNAIKTEPFKYAKDGKKRKPSPEEKAIVQHASKGVSKFRDNGSDIQTSVGFKRAGYGKITWNHAKSGTRTKYKMGYAGKVRQSESTEGKSQGLSVKPVEVIVNSINSGTSFMEKQPFARKAFKQNESKAMAAIENEIKEQLDDELDDGI